MKLHICCFFFVIAWTSSFSQPQLSDTLFLVQHPVSIDTTYWTASTVMKETILKDEIGQKTIMKYDSTGNIKAVINYDSRGAFKGNLVTFDTLGNIRSHSYFYEQYPWSTGFTLFESGDTASIKRFANDTLFSVEYYTTGAKKIVTYYDTSDEPRKSFYYYDNGVLQSHRFYKLLYYCINYDSLGQKRYEGWKNSFNANIGKCVYWDAQGKRSIEGEWKYSTNQNATKTGNWKYYNEKGRITKIERYDDKGKLIETIEYKRPKKDKNPVDPRRVAPVPADDNKK